MKNPHEQGPEMPDKPVKPDYELPDKPPPPVPEIDVPMGPGTHPEAPEIGERPESPEKKPEADGPAQNVRPSVAAHH